MSVQTTYSATPAIAFAGMLADASGNDKITMKNVEASAEIPFGRAVCFDLSSPASDYSALLPAAESDTVAGIVIHSHDYARSFTLADGTTAGELGATGLLPGTFMNVLRKGVIWVIVEDGCAVGDRLWVRAVAGGDPEFLGACNNADDSTDMIDCTKQGVFETSCSAGGLAKLRVDFTNKP